MDKIKILKRIRTPVLKSLSANELKLYLLFLVYSELDLKTIKRSLGKSFDLRQLKASLEKLEKMELGRADIPKTSPNRNVRVQFKLTQAEACDYLQW